MVTRVQFSLLFNRAWNQNGEYTIRVSVLQDLSRDAQWPKVSLRKLQSFVIDKITGVKYIPLYSPARPSLESPFTPKFSVHKVLQQELTETRNSGLQRESSVASWWYKLYTTITTTCTTSLKLPFWELQRHFSPFCYYALSLSLNHFNDGGESQRVDEGMIHSS